MHNQLSFENEQLFNRYESSFKLIENGQFESAHDNFLSLIDTGLSKDFPFSLLKSLKFWSLRSRRKLTMEVGEARVDYLLREWKKYEEFVTKNRLDIEESKALGVIKKAIYSQIVDNFILSLEVKKDFNEDSLYEIGVYLFQNGEYEKCYDAMAFLVKIKGNLLKKAKFYLANAIYFKGNKNDAFFYLKRYFLENALPDLKQIEIPELLNLVLELKEKLMSAEEICLWLPVFCVLEKVIPLRETTEDRRKMHRLISNLRFKVLNNDRLRNKMEPRLVYCYLILLAEMRWGRDDFSSSEVDKILNTLKTMSGELFLQMKALYE